MQIERRDSVSPVEFSKQAQPAPATTPTATPGPEVGSDRFDGNGAPAVTESERLAQVRAAVDAARQPAPEPAQALPTAGPNHGVQNHLLSHIPSPLRFVAIGAMRGIGQGLDWLKTHVFHQTEAQPNPSAPKDRAEATWKTIEQRYGIPGLPGVFSETDGGLGGLKPATVWPHGQAIAAALDVAQLTGDYSKVDETMKSLSNYKTNGAYGPSPITLGAKRLWDDNSWIGLDFMQAYQQTGNKDYLKNAESLFPFLQKGMSSQGGIYWEERNGRPSRNTCANAPAMALTLKLYQETKDPKYLDFAKNLDGFLDSKMRSPEGLYYDNLGDDGKLDKSLWSYNQGAAIGAKLQLYKTTGDPKALEDAKATAKAALDYYGQNDRLWKQPPSFNAIFFRNLLALDAVAPDPRYRQVMQQYVDRVWKEGRDPKTGELNQGGIGHYDPPGLLDQSGLAQMNALLAWPKDKLDQVG